jgi:hypothetical protein
MEVTRMGVGSPLTWDFPTIASGSEIHAGGFNPPPVCDHIGGFRLVHIRTAVRQTTLKVESTLTKLL